MNGSPEREQSVERLLRQSFKTPPVDAAACLDAATIAAWVDGGLSGSQLEIAQSHVADCARCQSIIGALARIDVSKHEPQPVPRRWLAWLVPITAVATAVALWISIPRMNAPEKQAANTIPPAFEGVPNPSFDKQEPAAPPASALESRQAREREEATDKRDLARNDQAKAAEVSKDSLREEDRKKESQLQSTATQSASAPPAGLADSGPSAAPPVRRLFRDQSANAVVEKLSIGIVSPDPAIHWRLSGSVVEHSTDSGASWDTVFDGRGFVLTAGVAPSPSICWVVGHAGVVLRSTDGRTFARVPFPETTDLTTVSATDGRTARVTTADGRHFVTTDGGAGWRVSQ